MRKRLLTEEDRQASKDRRRAWDRARHARCRDMRNAARKAAHAANPERLRAIDREKYAKNPFAHRDKDMKSKYGIVAANVYNSTNHCNSCGDEISGKKKHIDHDHSLPRKSAIIPPARFGWLWTG